ncbi:hypothetical protein CEXT_438111 [Caerostris extrusa]|uniref:Uncharacterized protein n=1 Tax=Caerostris extrusa TaxID=172846 RepID=A0AAV4MBF4_CAEEX|nr:hypothetical protein CEXT_438111 [Caerostris extrusa]
MTVCFHAAKRLQEGHYIGTQKESSRNYFFPHTMGISGRSYVERNYVPISRSIGILGEFWAFPTTMHCIRIAKKKYHRRQQEAKLNLR